jgi:hypothetical protein
MRHLPLDDSKLRVYIDMDHTFCDFDGTLEFWRKRALTEVEKNWPWSQPGFFYSLLPMPGALEFWNYWQDKADLWFLTRPSVPNLHCYTEKAQWVRKYLGEAAQEKLIISPRKDLVIGDILIDDAINCGQPFFQGRWWRFGTETTPDWKWCHESMFVEVAAHAQKKKESK